MKSILRLMGVFAITALIILGCKAPEIKTSDGSIIIKKVKLTDAFPGLRPREDHQFLVLSIEYKGKVTEKTLKQLDEVYVIGTDGLKVRVGYSGVDKGTPNMIFVVPVSAKDFKLYWPGNPPVKLGT